MNPLQVDDANISAFNSQAFESELKSILSYWIEKAQDLENGGLIGEIDNSNQSALEASKSAIMHTRVLWTFSEAYHLLKDKEYLKMADCIYEYILQYFLDDQQGGIFWELDYKGQVINSRKQIYAQAFAIYALSSYYQITGNKEALTTAIALFEKIETYSFDAERNGYLEALDRGWLLMEDFRLSEKDENAPKTMNTHLHILEAYTNLYRIWENPRLEYALENMIRVYLTKIIQSDTHFGLFFDLDWKVSNRNVSYGHEIEGSWLLYEAAEVLGNANLLSEVREVSVKLASLTANEGLLDGYAVLEEFVEGSGIRDNSFHWWPQAEAVVGFYNAYQLTQDDQYLTIAKRIWEFIQLYVIDHQNGEWFWHVNEEGEPLDDKYKVGFWKAPYHNGRTCIEMIYRLNATS